MRFAAVTICLIALSWLPQAVAAQEQFTFSGNGTASAADTNTSYTLKLRGAKDRQLEVYIDGVRVGLTPQVMRIKAGQYLVTASAEGVRPVIHSLSVVPTDSTVDLVMPALPMITSELPLVKDDLLKALEKQRGNGHLSLMLAMLANDRKDVDDLLAVAQKSLGPNNPTVGLVKARWLLVESRAEDALSIVDSFLAKEPNNVQLLRQKARICAVLERNQEAVAAAEQAVKIDPSDWQNYHVRGICRRESGDAKGARADLDQALLLSEGNPQVRKTLEALLKPKLPEPAKP